MSKDEQLKVLRDIRSTLDRLIALVVKTRPTRRIGNVRPKLQRHRTPEELRKLKEEAAALRQSGLRIGQIAQLLGVSQTYISRLTSDRKKSSALADDVQAKEHPRVHR